MKFNSTKGAISQLDEFDFHILEVLKQEGRISNQDLAEKVGLSPSPCLRRVRSLEENGVISGYKAVLDNKKLGLALMSIVGVSMETHTSECLANFERSIAQMPEVVECLLITGQAADYLLKIVVADMDEYQEVLLKKISRIEGVSGLHSSFVMRQIKV